MQERHAKLLVATVGVACLAVVGTLGGTYLADRELSESQGATPAALAATPVDASPSASAPRAAPSSAAPSRPSSQERQKEREEEPEDERPAKRTYRIDRMIYNEANHLVKLISAEVDGGKLRLNLRYSNVSTVPLPLTCPEPAVDRTSSQLTLSDGRTVRPESTWCGTRQGSSIFVIEPGKDLDSWGVFPVVPEAGTPFALSWYDYPVLQGVRLG